MSTNLIYFHINGEAYITMFDMLLKTIKDYLNGIDILVITIDKHREQISQLFSNYQIKNYHIHLTKYVSGLGNYSGKLDITDWKQLDSYSKVIYFDTDILFFPQALQKLFGHMTEKDKMYMVQEGFDFKEPWFYHKNIYNPEETQKIDNDLFRHGINTGTFGWINYPDCRIQKQLLRIRENVNEKSKSICTDAAEQPYINHRFLVDQNIETFDKFVCLKPLVTISELMNKSREEKHPITTSLCVFHFTYIKKIENMQEFLRLIGFHDNK